jgi:hypothetical protein
MIQINKTNILNQLNLKKTTVVLDSNTLNNNFGTYAFGWNNQKILFTIITNNLDVNLTSFNIRDDGGNFLTGNSAVHVGNYNFLFSDIVLSGAAASNLNLINFNYNYTGSALFGDITLEIYSIIP